MVMMMEVHRKHFTTKVTTTITIIITITITITTTSDVRDDDGNGSVSQAFHNKVVVVGW